MATKVATHGSHNHVNIAQILAELRHALRQSVHLLCDEPVDTDGLCCSTFPSDIWWRQWLFNHLLLYTSVTIKAYPSFLCISEDECEGHGEGESWEPQPCETCTCVGGSKVCAMPDCAPPLCDAPLEAEGVCCPYCEIEITGICLGQLLFNDLSLCKGLFIACLKC